jgi:hypothetical protein
MTTPHRWPQVSTYSQSRRGQARPRWPAGLQHLQIDQAATQPAPMPRLPISTSQRGVRT